VLRYLFLRLVSVTPVSCYGRNNGSASVEVYGGTAPYTYTWDTDPVQTGPIATNLQAGTYNVRVEDALGHTDELPVTIAQPLSALSATTSVTNVLCRGESSGSIEINVTGGTAPYSFLWSNDATTRNIIEVPAKQYTVNITDANGCSLIIGAKIEEPAEPLRISNIEIKGVKCIDDPFGSIKYDLSGGVPSYTYLWNNNATTQYLDNVVGGDYTVSVTDKVGCKLIQNFFVDYENTDCEVRVPSGLTPNGQFDNRLVIRGLENYPDNKIKIFNRYGSLVYEASPYQNDWDGSSNVHGNFTEADGKLPDGTYFYYLELGTSGNVKSGYVYLIKK
jgi:gliding motility-associated-like protein